MNEMDALKGTPRLMLEAELQPAQGKRFQPTGFADLGAATYRTPDGIDMLLVESAQSIANRLERAGLASDGPDIDPDLAGLPYVAATLTGVGESVRTSSLVEAHRLGSPYFLLNKDFKEKIMAEMAYNPKRPLDWARIYSVLFRYDPNSLLHGVFLSLLDGGRIKCPRAVTGFIEAEHIAKVISGGVKNSPIDPTGELQVASAEPGEKGVYSNVPYSRIEYTAKTITAYFNVDLSLIRGYRLPDAATDLLIALALLKIRRFLTTHLRLRTACEFLMHGDVKVTAPAGFVLPDEAPLLRVVQDGIRMCKDYFASPVLTELTTPVKAVKKNKEERNARGVTAGE
jgi:CRISPR-associated protein Csb1